MLDDLKRAHAEACMRLANLEGRLAYYKKTHGVPPAEFTMSITRARDDVNRTAHEIRQFLAASNVSA